MSVGGLVGGVVGGITGFFIGGPYGVFYGATIGFSLGMAIDPMTPDVPVAGTPLPAGSQIMLSEIGGPVPDLVGTGQITGHLLCFGKERSEAIMVQPEGGKGGGSPDPYISGYKYYMSWAVGIVAGPIDKLYTIYRNEDVMWEGELELPASGGQETIVLEGMGSAIFYFGTADQIANSDVGEIIDDETLNSPYRHFCWCFFDNCYIGEYNRCPTMKFVLGKYPVIAFSGDNAIQTYDYNPMHAIWYILHDLAGLPETWLHTADFASAAATLATETRGICCLFMQQQNTLDYLESVNNHIDGIIRYGSDGKFHPKLIREDYVINDLPLIDENVMLEDPTLNRKSWIDTVNEMKVQYTEIPGYVQYDQGKWVAAMSQPGTKYVYLYDITYKAVIKIETSIPPIIAETLPLESLYDLDYEGRGGYRMEDDSTLWYFFRDDSGDCQLIEVDISQSSMSITKKTTFSGLLAGYGISDGCSDGTYTYWSTSQETGRIIKIRNSDHSIVDDHNFDFDVSGCEALEEGIRSIDVDRDTGNLYWCYVLNHISCSPGYNACVYRIISDSNLNILVEHVDCGSVTNAPFWQNMTRIFSGYVMHHRNYYPTVGYLQKRSLLDWSLVSNCGGLGVDSCEIGQELLQNMLGVRGNCFFTLMHEYISCPAYLYCLDFSKLTETSKKDVSVYCCAGMGQGASYISAMNEVTEHIVLIRWNITEGKNYVASFAADSGLGLLDDSIPLIRR